MEYAVLGKAASPALEQLVSELEQALRRDGFEGPGEIDTADLVLNLIDRDAPKPFRRRSRGTFAASLHERPERPDDPLAAGYPLLVQALANVGLAFVPPNEVWFTTMERGAYAVHGDTPAELAANVVERLSPLARARLVIDNDFRTDLEPELWDGDEATEEIREAGIRLGEHGLLPAPFPIEELLGERELRHVKRLYGIGGLSYGNLSRRCDERRFWMSASGVDKTQLDQPGRDILLVSGYDADERKIVVSVPPGIEPRRVSVDAIEHWMIYGQHPDVGAILHVHAWMEGILATDINYPCGTEELAVAVSELIAAEPDPANAVVGLRNHGITATGPNLTEILDRIEPRLLRQVPMT